MAERKSLKTALILSVLMLLLFVASMVGSTWAWFTDQAVSGRNVIQAGTLDVELEYSRDGVNWHDTNPNTRLFDESKSMIPGTEQMVYLRIKNNGSLHLKYKLAMNILEEDGSTNMQGEDYKLSQYIMVGAISDSELKTKTPEELQAMLADPPRAADSKPLAEANNLLRAAYPNEANPDLEEAYLAPGEFHTMALIVYTPENLDQEINYPSDVNPPKIKFGIDVVAGQRSAGGESDSFGTGYDIDATYPEWPGN